MYTLRGILTFIKRLASIAPQPLCRLDNTGHHLAPAGDADRQCQKQVRTRGRKRAPAKASDHFPSTGEMTCLYQNRPHAPGSSGEGGSDM